MVGVLGVKTRSFLSLPAVVVLGRDAFVPLVARAPLRAHSTVVARICSSAKNIRGYLRHPCRSWRAEEYAQTRRARWASALVPCSNTAQDVGRATPPHIHTPVYQVAACHSARCLAPPKKRLLGGELGACSPHGLASLPAMAGWWRGPRLGGA